MPALLPILIRANILRNQGTIPVEPILTNSLVILTNDTEILTNNQ